MVRVVLVSMDGLLCDYKAALSRAMEERFGVSPIELKAKSLPGNIREYGQVNPEYAACAKRIIREKGFFENAPSVPEAIKGIEYLESTSDTKVVCMVPSAGKPTRPSG
ncbi:hypothetical protein FOZ62_010919 [Perkinsus olseni]|uniref:Pseudouridine-5'-phosphatase n=2 Tax=Perkinsus olseni TaxID=32597 RepID=A0A7J6SEN9_PEROL|nr:hypothetical protein FOZ62_010919 [Perkinsus olseni]